VLPAVFAMNAVQCSQGNRRLAAEFNEELRQANRTPVSRAACRHGGGACKNRPLLSQSGWPVEVDDEQAFQNVVGSAATRSEGRRGGVPYQTRATAEHQGKGRQSCIRTFVAAVIVLFVSSIFLAHELCDWCSQAVFR